MTRSIYRYIQNPLKIILEHAQKLFKLFLSNIINNSWQSELDYIYLVEHSNMGVYIIQDNLFNYVNKRWCEIHGYSFDEVVNKVNPLETVYQEDKKLVQEQLNHYGLKVHRFGETRMTESHS